MPWGLGKHNENFTFELHFWLYSVEWSILNTLDRTRKDTDTICFKTISRNFPG